MTNETNGILLFARYSIVHIAVDTENLYSSLLPYEEPWCHIESDDESFTDNSIYQPPLYLGDQMVKYLAVGGKDLHLTHRNTLVQTHTCKCIQKLLRLF